jgi:DNA-directed RNA polymerase subunit RPC12/RpoP
MSTNNKEPRWAERVRRHKILRLYETEAMGIEDMELLEDVAFAFYARCESIVTVTEASMGRLKCHGCGNIIPHRARKDELIKCEKCSWEMLWGDYFKSYHKKQLYGGTAIDVFRDAVRTFPSAAKSYKTLILWVDRLIHECHKAITPPDQEQLYTRPTAVNLIDGTMSQVVVFLENLPYGPGSQPEMRDQLITWRKRVLSGVPSAKEKLITIREQGKGEKR